MKALISTTETGPLGSIAMGGSAYIYINGYQLAGQSVTGNGSNQIYVYSTVASGADYTHITASIDLTNATVTRTSDALAGYYNLDIQLPASWNSDQVLTLTGAQANNLVFNDLPAQVLVRNVEGLMDANGNITTLGRGGSDTTGVALAAALKADECQIYTDVDGVYTTDPRVVPEARRLDKITFEEMLELASQGSKVLQIRSVEFAGKYKVKLRVLSSFEDEGEGTLITFEEENNMEQPVISGIAFNRDEAKITVLGVPDRPGIAYQILGPIAEANVDVDMIIQNTGADGTTDFTFTVHKNEMNKALSILRDKVQAHIGAREISGEDKIAKVSIVGVGMRSHVGIASKMFRILAEEGINIQMISTSEIKIAVVIDEKYLELAVRVLHKAFELDAE